MKITSFKSFGALAFIGLSVSLSSTNTFAHDYGRGGYKSSHYEASRCGRLPHNARTVTYRGESCWESHGCYYRKHPLGGYVIFERPAVETVAVEEQQDVQQSVVDDQQVVEQPAVEDTQYAADDSVSLEEDDTVVETLPSECQTVVVDGETCWEHNGVYYRHCNGGYRVCHRGSSKKGHYPMKGKWPNDRKSKNGSWPKTTSNKGGTWNKKGNPTGDPYGPNKSKQTGNTTSKKKGNPTGDPYGPNKSKQTGNTSKKKSNPTGDPYGTGKPKQTGNTTSKKAGGKGLSVHHNRQTGSTGSHGKTGKHA